MSLGASIDRKREISGDEANLPIDFEVYSFEEIGLKELIKEE
jgi:hypothetical protein